MKVNYLPNLMKQDAYLDYVKIRHGILQLKTKKESKKER